MRAALLAIVLAGCTTAATDDGEAEMAPPQPVGKTDAAQFLGLYASHATHHYDGDIPDLELRSDGQFVRERCYHASCAIAAPETDAYDEYTSSSGHTYVRFYGQKIADNETSIADVYEIRAFSGGVQLRKAYSTRWQSLYTTTEAHACTASGGTYANNSCGCPANQPSMFPAQTFVPGAGGCIATPGASESNCDDSHGMWTDDDATAIGSYCICSIGEYLAATGSCTAL